MSKISPGNLYAAFDNCSIDRCFRTVCNFTHFPLITLILLGCSLRAIHRSLSAQPKHRKHIRSGCDRKCLSSILYVLCAPCSRSPYRSLGGINFPSRAKFATHLNFSWVWILCSYNIPPCIIHAFSPSEECGRPF
jgi:hypothetical protein